MRQFNLVTGLPSSGLPPGSLLTTREKLYTKSFGIFADATLDVSNRLSLIAGIRYSRDSLREFQDNTLQVGLASAPLKVESS